MGKTRTAVVSGTPEEKSAGEAKYEEKKKRQAEKAAKEDKKKQHVKGVGLKGGERIKVVTGGPLPEKLKEEPAVTQALARRGKPTLRGKKYKEARAKVDKTKPYPVSHAVKLAKETSYTAFDGTVELHLVVKFARRRGGKEGLSISVKLPYSTGKKKKVEIADSQTLKKLKSGKIDFDVLLATPEIMPRLVPYAKLLGPKGLMPNPKNGTLIKELKEAKKFSGNSITLTTEKKAPIIHTTVGKVSQKDKELVENIQAIIAAIGSKQIKKAVLSSTMGPGIKLEIG